MSEQDTYEILKYRTEVDEYGIRSYYDNSGQLRRLDGALHSAWYHNNQRHRTDGPAIEWASGRKDWFINGKILTEAEFKEAVKHND